MIVVIRAQPWHFLTNTYQIHITPGLTVLQGVDGYLKEPNILHEAAHEVLDAGTSYARGDLGGLLMAGVTLVKELTNTPEKRELHRRTMTSPADVVQLSGCKDYQTSADTMEGVSTIGFKFPFEHSFVCKPVLRLMVGTTDRGNELGLSASSPSGTATEL